MEKLNFTNLKTTGQKIQRFMRPLYNACSATSYSVNSTATFISINNQKYIIFARHAFSNTPAFDKYLYMNIGKRIFKFSEELCYNFDDISLFKADNKIIECAYDLSFFNCNQHISLDYDKGFIAAWNGYHIKQEKTLHVVNNFVNEILSEKDGKYISPHARFLITAMPFLKRENNFLFFEYPRKDVALNKVRQQLAPLPKGLSGGPIIIRNAFVKYINNNNDEEFDTIIDVTFTGNIYLIAIGLELHKNIALGYNINDIVDKVNSIAPSFEFQESILHI